MVQGKIDRGRHTDHLAGCHSSQTNRCQPPSSPIFTLLAMGNKYREKCECSVAVEQRQDCSFHTWINVLVAGRTVWSLVNTCQPECFRDEYRTHYKAVYKCLVCFKYLFSNLISACCQPLTIAVTEHTPLQWNLTSFITTGMLSCFSICVYNTPSLRWVIIVKIACVKCQHLHILFVSELLSSVKEWEIEIMKSRTSINVVANR